MYLEKRTPLLKCKDCGDVHIRSQREPSAYDFDSCHICGSERYEALDEDYEYSYWSVGVYSVGQQYGGPEEGGWYYLAGDLIMENKVRVFEEFDKAVKYRWKLQKKYADWPDTAVYGFNEKMPVKGFPEISPRYC